MDFDPARASWAIRGEQSTAIRTARRARRTIARMRGTTQKVGEIDAWLAAHERRD